MGTKKKHEGYLCIDHRAAGIGGLLEAATYTCKHCCRVVVMNPLRTRNREWCAKCDHYICDDCGRVMAQTGVCKTFDQIIEEAQAAASKVT